MDQKFTREWKGKVKVEKLILGDDTVHFISAAKGEMSGQWDYLEERVPHSGETRRARFGTASEAMGAAQRLWTAKQKAKIVRTEKVFG